MLIKNPMSDPTQEELKESIKQLSDYRDRLQTEVISISQKLKMSPKKITSIINSHKELNQLQGILSRLNSQHENIISNNSK